MKASIDVNQLLYEGIKKVAKEKGNKIWEIIEIALIEYMAKRKSVFSQFEKLEFEKLEFEKMGKNKKI